ncbi:MAG: tyrosine-type recombinase/integrase [Alphaproteobacteria bacterium]
MIKQITQALINNIEPKEKPFEVFDTNVKGLLLRVQPTGNCTFYFAFKALNGKKARIKIGQAKRSGVGDITPIIARKRAEEYRVICARGVDPREEIKEKIAKATQDRGNTLSAFSQHQYQLYVKSHHKDAYNTIQRLKHFEKEWGDLPLDKITTKHIEDYRQKRIKQGLTHATINRDLNILKGLFSRGIEWGAIADTPFRRLKNLRVDKKGNTRFLSKEEEQALRGALRERDRLKREKRASSDKWHLDRGYELHTARYEDYAYVDYLEPMVLVALNTGMRRGELLSLTWQDIDLKQNIISLKGKNTKSAQSRNIPMNDEVKDIITKLHDEGVTAGDYLFTHPLTGKPMKEIGKAWREVVKQAGIEGFRFHDLRHTFASNLARHNQSPYTLQSLLGHSSLEMVQRYAHIGDDTLQDAVNSLLD